MLKSLRRFGDAGRIGHYIRTRTHAAATLTARSERSPACYVSEELRAKNMLRALDDLLPRILEPSVLEREGWPDRISNAVKRLGTQPYQHSVAFWSPATSSSMDLITALLEDPFSSDDTRRSLLARRWDHRDSHVLRISYNPTLGSSEDTHSDIKVASSWLHNAETTIVEVHDNDPQRVITHLLNADIIVLVFESPWEMLPHGEVLRPLFRDSFETRGDLHIIANNALCGTEQGKQALHASFADSLAGLISRHTGPRIHFHAVASEAAIDAQAAFRRDQLKEALAASPSPPYAAAVSRFQDSLELSGLPRLSESVLKSLGSFRDNYIPSPPVRSSMATVSAAVHRARGSINSAVEEIKDTQDRIRRLSVESRSQIRKFKEDLFADGKLVSASTNSSRKGVETYLSSLRWWKLPWRVDELASDITNILKSTYARDLERKLVYQTGRFVSLQDSIETSVLRAVTYPPTSPLHSPLLLNSLEQLDVQQSIRLSPTSLLSPIERRLAQMISRSGSPLAHLHLRAQILLLQTYGLSIGGPAAAWGSWAAGVAGEELAMGAGTLSFVLGLRWAVGRWERAKRRWWESWDRVDEGLERDLENQFNSTTENVVLSKTSRAVDGLEHLAARRTEHLQELSFELETIWRDALEVGGHTKKSTNSPD